MLSREQIASNYRDLRESIPEHVQILVAAKTRTPEEVGAVIDAGARIIGENYVQEARGKRRALGEKADRAEWHMIGHLQRNKVRDALQVFDLVQSVDSVRLARAIAARGGAVVPVYVEVNIGGEESKFGVAPERLADLVEELAGVENLRVEGLMTMEPYFDDPEGARPYFRRMKALFDELRARGTVLKTLSMGMSNSLSVAVEEGSTMIRPGTAIFGPRG